MAYVVVFAGEYDLANMGDLRRELSQLVLIRDLVLDMSAVIFIDSCFISELIRMQQARTEKKLSRVKLVSRRESAVRRVLEVTGMLSLFDVVDEYSNEGCDPAGSTVRYSNVWH